MDQQPARHPRDAGFTAIELLIVIVMIGILSGITVLAFGPFSQSATAACDRANARIAAGVDTATAASEEFGLEFTSDDFLDGTVAQLTGCEFVEAGGSSDRPAS